MLTTIKGRPWVGPEASRYGLAVLSATRLTSDMFILGAVAAAAAEVGGEATARLAANVNIAARVATITRALLGLIVNSNPLVIDQALDS